jgi:hypothetical protein
MPEKPCGAIIRITKLQSMSLSGREGKKVFLALVLREIQKNMSVERSLDIAEVIIDDTRVKPEDTDVSTIPDTEAFEKMLEKFDAAPVGSKLSFNLNPSFVNIIYPWMFVPENIRRSCLDSEFERLSRQPPVGPLQCWRPILKDLTPPMK